MSTTPVSTQATGATAAPGVPMAFEVAMLPVSDVDRAKDFYLRLGWRMDIDFHPAPGARLVQFTPPGSPASIHFGEGVTTMRGPLQGMILVVEDLAATREDLLARGVDVGEITHADPERGQVAGPDPSGSSYSQRAAFSDPDGNEWQLQQITERLPGRV